MYDVCVGMHAMAHVGSEVSSVHQVWYFYVSSRTGFSSPSLKDKYPSLMSLLTAVPTPTTLKKKKEVLGLETWLRLAP